MHKKSLHSIKKQGMGKLKKIWQMWKINRTFALEAKTLCDAAIFGNSIEKANFN